MAMKKSLKIRILAASNFIALIPSRSIRQILPFFFWSWILKDYIEVQQKEKKFVVLCSATSSTKREIRYIFSRRSRAVTAKKCTKKHDAGAESLFCLSKPVAFLLFSLTSPWSLLIGDVTSDNSHTMIFSATQRCNVVAALFRIVTTLFQHYNAVLHCVAPV